MPGRGGARGGGRVRGECCGCRQLREVEVCEHCEKSVCGDCCRHCCQCQAVFCPYCSVLKSVLFVLWKLIQTHMEQKKVSLLRVVGVWDSEKCCVIDVASFEFILGCPGYGIDFFHSLMSLQCCIIT